MPTKLPSAAPEANIGERIRSALASYWGFSELRPLQLDAVKAALAGRDALVVLPTGGGKSLCYQLPPLLRGAGEASLCVVVSPLIALMKDQADGLKLAGYPAAAMHSGSRDGGSVRAEVEAGRIKLLLVAPERLLGEGFLAWLANLGRRDPSRAVASFAIDEAHCISQWGHDFRPEYRRLAELREVFPGVPMQAFTATATPRVREDIAQQLHMHDPAVLVGVFDRPNLTYRIVPRLGSGIDQIEEVLRRHGEEAAIVYCMSRKQTEQVAGELTSRGLRAEAYHAGMEAGARHRVQDAFAGEKLDIVVATVAFGMGIDRGDVRCVIHAAMPKSVEAYQQETGRAGRDGLPAECVLLHSGADLQKWQGLVERSAFESEVRVPREVIDAQVALVAQMNALAAGVRCRHRALSEYFGQEYRPPTAGIDLPLDAAPSGSPAPREGCNACDVCLGELESEPDSTTVARKIISCVARLRGAGEREQAFGAAYIADVLRGAGIGTIVERKHHLQSTFGLLRDMARENIVGFIHQLVDAGVLARAPGKYATIHLTAASGPVLRGEREVKLLRARSAEQVAASDRQRKRADYSGVAGAPLSGDERALFEHLRRTRRAIADGLGVPPFVVFGDAALEEMSRVRPGSLETFAHIRGVGRAKLDQFGERFVAAIGEFCRNAGFALDAGQGSRPRPALATEPRERSISDSKRRAFELFAGGLGIDDVAARIGRARSTTGEYLVEFVEMRRPADISPWVSGADYQRVIDAVAKVKAERLKPVHEELGGTIGYEQIKIVLHHRASAGRAASDQS